MNKICLAVLSRVVFLATYYELRTTSSMVCVKSTKKLWVIAFLKEHRQSWQSDSILISVDENKINPYEDVMLSVRSIANADHNDAVGRACRKYAVQNILYNAVKTAGPSMGFDHADHLHPFSRKRSHRGSHALARAALTAFYETDDICLKLVIAAGFDWSHWIMAT